MSFIPDLRSQRLAPEGSLRDAIDAHGVAPSEDTLPPWVVPAVGAALVALVIYLLVR